MIDAIRHFGAVIDMEGDTLYVQGTAGKFRPAEDVIQCGNSGQVLRFIGALAAFSPSYTLLTGDLSIRHKRPIQPLLEALTQLGAFAVSSRLDGYAPIVVKGLAIGGKATLDGRDSQPVSALLILGSLIPIELTVTNPGEKPWINLTLSWLDKLNIPYENRDFKSYRMKGLSHIDAFDYTVASDFSSAAFPICAALVTGSELTLDQLDLEDVQGDKEIIPILKSMGAHFTSTGSQLTVKRGAALKGRKIDVNDVIDALPILAVMGCYAEGKTEIVGGAIAREKESDRISAIATELKKMGADIEETPDGLMIRQSQLKGSMHLEAHQDHRIGMALIVAAMGAKGESVVHSVECISKSYPGFFTDFAQIGAIMELL
jgi:3-phosphoshikimate 1-carboxyvinyltransferase